MFPADAARALASEPKASDADASAPWSNSTLTQAPEPATAARCSGRSPASSATLGSAPASSTHRSAAAAPCAAATCAAARRGASEHRASGLEHVRSQFSTGPTYRGRGANISAETGRGDAVAVT